jgi:hypothetical protein
LSFAANIPGFPADSRSGRSLLLAQVVGLAATGWLVWTNSVAPRLAIESPWSIAARACFYVLLMWALSALITFLVYLVVADEEPANLVAVSLRSSAAAVWFAPAIILLSTLSPAGLFASLVLIVNTSRLLILGWMPTDPTSPQQPVRWNPQPAIWAALLLQTGMVALLWKNPLLAAALFALSAAIVTALAITRSGAKPGKPPVMPPSTLNIALTILLAVVFSAASLKFRGYASGDGGPADASVPNSNGGSATELADPEAMGFPVGYGGFPGVILRPVQKPKSSTLVFPRPSLLKEGEQRTHPLSIPFTGEYWMYQPPFTQPPRTSIRRQGTPLELSFHTNNGSSMSMEARQKLETPIELRCCGRLEIEIAMKDAVGDLRLQVTLMDSQARQRVDLGIAPVGQETAQTLRYAIPPGHESLKVDEIRILYRRPVREMSRSSALAVEGFLLVPVGQ